MKITIEPSEGEYFPVDWDVIKHGNDALICLYDIGIYLRTLSDKGRNDDISSEIYERFFDMLHEHNLSRDIIGF